MLESMPCSSESWGGSRASFVTLDPTKTNELCQLQEVHRRGPGLALLQLWIESQPCALQAQLLCEVSYDSASCKLH